MRSRSRASGRSSNRSLTRSEMKKALRGPTCELVVDLTQEIRAKLEPLILPQASPTTVGMSPHRVQAKHLLAGLTNTLGSPRSRLMPTPAAIPRSPFVLRTAQPPYSHVGNSTRDELDRLGLTALRALMDVEPYGSSDLGDQPARGWRDRDHKAREKKKKKKRKNQSAKNTPRQPSQEGLGTGETRAQHTRPHRAPEPETAGGKRGAHETTHVPKAGRNRSPTTNTTNSRH